MIKNNKFYLFLWSAITLSFLFVAFVVMNKNSTFADEDAKEIETGTWTIETIPTVVETWSTNTGSTDDWSDTNTGTVSTPTTPPTTPSTPITTTSIDNQSGYILNDNDKALLSKLYWKIDVIVSKSESRAKKLITKIQELKLKVKLNWRAYKILSQMEEYTINALASKYESEDIELNIFNEDDAEDALKSMCDASAQKLKSTWKVYLALYRYTPNNYYDYYSVSKYFTWNSFKSYMTSESNSASIFMLKNPINDFTGENKFVWRENNPVIPTDYISCRYWSQKWENTKYLYCEWNEEFKIEKNIGSDGQILWNWWIKTYFYKLSINVADTAIEWQEYKDAISKYNNFKIEYEKWKALYSWIDYTKLTDDEWYKAFVKRYSSGENNTYYQIYTYEKSIKWNSNLSDSEKSQQINQYLEQKLDEIYRKYFFVADVIDITCQDTSIFSEEIKTPLTKE